ncbi:MAG: hypothetical protein VBE63_08235 [Lamprobacter sp.]|uniref:hypothetical protein n=1 Tax=Lamprobacter sp. TaxID=3100796 RepID=UPI002B25FA0C|nr:hypothetical protein [Lamprobacter sp.]MEA3639917.1 hypothetical protein [Lamprobacter sp.]
MAMPGDVLSGDPAVGEILDPDTWFAYRCPWIDYERGGVDVGDPSQGYNVQTWRLRGMLAPCNRYDGQWAGDWRGLVLDAPGNSDIPPRRLWPVADVREVALAFDQNMRPAAAFVDGAIGKLYWYDSDRAKTVVDVIPGMRSPRLCLDDKRVTQTAASDILLFYLADGKVCMRRQRDRFSVLYVLKERTGARALGRVGMGSNWRLHIELVYDGTNPGRPWYPEAPCLPKGPLDPDKPWRPWNPKGPCAPGV